eukprot:2335053-Rhodomonas_salina.1
MPLPPRAEPLPQSLKVALAVPLPPRAVPLPQSLEVATAAPLPPRAAPLPQSLANYGVEYEGEWVVLAGCGQLG